MLVRGGPAAKARGAGAGGAGGLPPGRDRAEGRRRPPPPPEPPPLTLGGIDFASARETVADKRAETRMKGYVGEACPECGNFTMVRNGTCLKCDTCGSTTGCS